jgi:hypothetical protein
MGVSLLRLPFFTAWLVWTSAYVGIALVRAGVYHTKQKDNVL